MRASYLKKVNYTRERKPPAEWSEQGKRIRMNDLLDDAPDDIKQLFRFDDYSLWSFTHLAIGNELCEELLKLDGINRNSTITDAMAGIGGNTISFAQSFNNVIAVEPDDNRRDMLEHNLDLCNIENVKVIAGYYQTAMSDLRQDVIFVDPPWGIDYRKDTAVRINIDGPHLLTLEALINTLPFHKYCAVKIPFNYDMKHFTETIKGTIVTTLTYPRPNTCTIVIIQA